MIVKRLALGKRGSLRKPRLKCWWFMHSSMAGSYDTPCEIVKDHGDDCVTIDFFDFVIDDWQQQVQHRSRLTFK